jgi:hypothetical protein
MGSKFTFRERVEFSPEVAEGVLLAVPALPGVFCLRGERETDEPYLMRAADLRRRLRRLLDPPAAAPDGSQLQTKRLNLRERVRSIEYTVTGSEFESLLLLYDASAACFGAAAARKRLKLFPPYFLRLTLEHSHPRVYATNRLSAKGLPRTYGPFPSRAAAERYCDAVLDLFRLRRCWEDLEVHPDHPGCAYGEMKKCMAPCNTTCSAAEYAAEAVAVEAFFRTHGESMLAGIAAERERASAEMEFEAAAAAHERYSKVKAAAALADELVRPVPELRAVVVQAAAGEDLEAAAFLLEGGRLVGPERMSTLGVRAVKEQTSVGSSLFAQPLMLAAVPLEGEVAEVDSPEVRAGRVLERLEALAGGRSQLAEAKGGALAVGDPTDRGEAALNGAPGSSRGAEPQIPPGNDKDKGAAAVDLAFLGDHLALFRRWYYRPEKQRAGEVFLPNPDGTWPVRRILRGAARMALGEPKAMSETDRDGAAAARTRIIHEGREGVERVVPVLAASGRRGRKSR